MRPLALLNVLLAGISLASLVYIVHEVTPSATAFTTHPRPTSRPIVAAPSATPEPSPRAGNYDVVVSRNLFSPTRTETAPPTGGATASASPKPNLYGVVLRDGAPIAYLEDPATKRVAAYRTGDTVAGGRVQIIAADHVVLARPEGRVEVRLNDPAKARPQTPPLQPTPGQIAPLPGGLPQPGTPPLPAGRRLPREG